MGSEPPTKLIGHSPEPGEYSPQEQESLTTNLVALLQRIHSGGYSGSPLTPDLIRELHYNIFRDVRAFAGRMRGPGEGSERLVFGPHRSIHSSDVATAVDRLLAELRKALGSLEANTDDPEYELAAIRIAAWAHADLIRIHPFEDGNGRSSRALMSLLLVRCGLRPIPMEAPKQDYLACLNHYFTTGEIEKLVQLCLRLYPDLE